MSTAEVSRLTARGKRTRQALLTAAEAVFGAHGYERASIARLVDALALRALEPLRVFGAHGYERVSITAITQAAGVAQGTFYVYFADKQSIFTELVRALRTSLGEALREAVKGGGSRLEVERAGLRAALVINRYRASPWEPLAALWDVDACAISADASSADRVTDPLFGMSGTVDLEVAEDSPAASMNVALQTGELTPDGDFAADFDADLCRIEFRRCAGWADGFASTRGLQFVQSGQAK